jgi:hypothetical protein
LLGNLEELFQQHLLVVVGGGQGESFNLLVISPWRKVARYIMGASGPHVNQLSLENSLPLQEYLWADGQLEDSIA